jgi:epoxyqueuosine reductase
MTYLHRSAGVRADIRHFVPSARTVVMTASVYATRDEPTAPRGRAARDAVGVARYARGEDYHVVLRRRLEALVAWMRRDADGPFDAVTFVDTRPVQERVYAQHAGLGWIGKNTCLINPELGSWLFLSGVATSLALETDAPGLDQCAACTLCLDACPTGALVDAHVLDATKCISYLTIELEGPIPGPQRAGIGSHAYGCDICQDVCPWNFSPAVTTDPAFAPRPRDGARASELWQRTDHELHEFVKGSAMTYLSMTGLRRNLAIVIGNTGDRQLADVLDRPGHGRPNAAPSAKTGIVRDAVEWAKARLIV